jgi:V/A-type H+/Na+-transporting ATPase subunit E
MNDKLQELTRKIYDEGLEKGKKEAQEIIDNAKKEADAILDKARTEAKQLAEKASKDAEEQKKNVHSELAMATRQAVATVKQKIAGLLNQKAVEQALGKTFDDKEFIKSIIKTIADHWGEISKSDQGIMVFLSEKDRDQLESFLMNKVATNIKQGMDIDFEEGIKSGFRIGPKDQSFKISFTDKDFENFFKQYLRPRTQKFFTDEQ